MSLKKSEQISSVVSKNSNRSIPKVKLKYQLVGEKEKSKIKSELADEEDDFNSEKMQKIENELQDFQ